MVSYFPMPKEDVVYFPPSTMITPSAKELPELRKQKLHHIIMVLVVVWIAMTKYAAVIILEEQTNGRWLYFSIFNTYLATTHLSFAERLLKRVSHIQRNFFVKCMMRTIQSNMRQLSTSAVHHLLEWTTKPCITFEARPTS